jgi:hypothetical protein
MTLEATRWMSYIEVFVAEDDRVDSYFISNVGLKATCLAHWNDQPPRPLIELIFPLRPLRLERSRRFKFFPDFSTSREISRLDMPS